MKKFLLVMFTFAFISSSFANDLSKSVIEKNVKSKIETLSTLTVKVNSAIFVLPTVLDNDKSCSATLVDQGGNKFTITAKDCITVARIVAALYN